MMCPPDHWYSSVCTSPICHGTACQIQALTVKSTNDKGHLNLPQNEFGVLDTHIKHSIRQLPINRFSDD